MPRNFALQPSSAVPLAAWRGAIAQLAAAWLALFALTFAAWQDMAHQWWNIDTYNHVLLVPGIVAWLVWLRRGELARVRPQGWSPGLAWTALGLSIWLIGTSLAINLVAQTGAVVAVQGIVLAILGPRAALLLAFPLFYALFLVPFGDELIPALQLFTAEMTITLSHLSGIPATIDGLFIDTPAGRFVVAEECAGVKFLVAMVALATLAAWTGFRHWPPRIALVVGAALVSILANGVRAWGTIFAAQYVGIERAGGFDHIVYGWVFFAIIIVAVLGVAWRFFDREPEDAGLTADELSQLSLGGADRFAIDGRTATIGAIALAIGFAVVASLV